MAKTAQCRLEGSYSANSVFTTALGFVKSFVHSAIFFRDALPVMVKRYGGLFPKPEEVMAAGSRNRAYRQRQIRDERTGALTRAYDGKDGHSFHLSRMAWEKTVAENRRTASFT